MKGQLEAYQAINKQATIDKLKATAALIDEEIAQTGYYPEKYGRLSRKELCRRAGVGESTLKNPTHRATNARVKARLRKAARAKGKAPPPLTEDPANSLEQKHALLANHYNASKIECAQLRAEKADLEAEVIDLKRQLAEALADDNVTLLSAWRKPHPNA